MVGSMTFALISTRDTDPPVFTLTFISSFGPPSVVTCTLNNIALNTSLYTVSREVTRPQYTSSSEPDMTRVTVTMRTRQSGTYRCSVTVMGRNDSVPQQVVTLGSTADTAANVTGKNNKYTTVLLYSALIVFTSFSCWYTPCCLCQMEYNTKCYCLLESSSNTANANRL